ncbi:unnamed protein product [Musa textilis]
MMWWTLVLLRHQQPMPTPVSSTKTGRRERRRRMRTKGGMSRQQQKDKPGTEPARPTFLTLSLPHLSLTRPTQHTIQKRGKKKEEKEKRRERRGSTCSSSSSSAAAMAKLRREPVLPSADSNDESDPRPGAGGYGSARAFSSM